MISLEVVKDKLKLDGRYWIAFVGDSITSCEWVHPNWRDIVQYVLQNEITDLLEGDWKTSEWGIKGFNFGYDGATTRDIVEKIVDIKLIRPDLVISLMGGNDPTLNVSVDESIKNISNFVGRVDTQVVWCNSIPAGLKSKKNIEYKPYADAFMNELDASDSFHKIDMFNIYQQFDTSKFFTFISEENTIEKIKAGEIDLQHPNQLGNAYIAKVILKEVFGIEFDPNKYWADTKSGEKLPKY